LTSLPRVCLKIPTGGGKTILAAYVLKIAADIWLEKTYSVVLWFAPSDTIRRQTAEALKNPHNPLSFCLPTSTDKFYPDFIAKLNDGRILIVEYKDAHLIDAKDTKEKRLIGELWEKHTKGKGLFMIAEKSRDGLNATEQIKIKIGAL
jgi:hypothetical protein